MSFEVLMRDCAAEEDRQQRYAEALAREEASLTRETLAQAKAGDSAASSMPWTTATTIGWCCAHLCCALKKGTSKPAMRLPRWPAPGQS